MFASVRGRKSLRILLSEIPTATGRADLKLERAYVYGSVANGMAMDLVAGTGPLESARYGAKSRYPGKY
jgi:hypothetical protein